MTSAKFWCLRAEADLLLCKFTQLFPLSFLSSALPLRGTKRYTQVSPRSRRGNATASSTAGTVATSRRAPVAATDAGVTSGARAATASRPTGSATAAPTAQTAATRAPRGARRTAPRGTFAALWGSASRPSGRATEERTVPTAATRRSSCAGPHKGCRVGVSRVHTRVSKRNVVGASCILQNSKGRDCVCGSV